MLRECLQFLVLSLCFQQCRGRMCSWHKADSCFEEAFQEYAISLCVCRLLRTFGGTPNRDPCSLWALIWGHPRNLGVI